MQVNDIEKISEITEKYGAPKADDGGPFFFPSLTWERDETQIVMFFFGKGKGKSNLCYRRYGVIHRPVEEGPAKTYYSEETGLPVREEYWVDGFRMRTTDRDYNV